MTTKEYAARKHPDSIQDVQPTIRRPKKKNTEKMPLINWNRIFLNEGEKQKLQPTKKCKEQSIRISFAQIRSIMIKFHMTSIRISTTTRHESLQESLVSYPLPSIATTRLWECIQYSKVSLFLRIFISLVSMN